MVAGAGAIITSNVRDFPLNKIPPGLDVLLPAVFAAATVALDPARALGAVEKIAARSGRKGPPDSVTDVLDLLVSRYGMTDAVE